MKTSQYPSVALTSFSSFFFKIQKLIFTNSTEFCCDFCTAQKSAQNLKLRLTVKTLFPLSNYYKTLNNLMVVLRPFSTKIIFFTCKYALFKNHLYPTIIIHNICHKFDVWYSYSLHIMINLVLKVAAPQSNYLEFYRVKPKTIWFGRPNIQYQDHNDVKLVEASNMDIIIIKSCK